MITIENFLRAIKFKISETSKYEWECYGSNAHSMDYWNGEHDGYSASMVFDSKSNIVYEMNMCDYENYRAYRWISPKYEKKHANECSKRHVEDVAWQGVEWIPTMSSDDILEKISCIMNNKQYSPDPVVSVRIKYNEMVAFNKVSKHLNEPIQSILERLVRLETVENLLKME